MRKRMLSTLLALCMVLGMLPGTAFARQGTYLLDSGLSIPYTKLGRQEAMIGMIDANSVANIVFPDSIDGYVITSFTASTFGLCSELKSVTIPSYTSSLQWSFLPHGVAGLGACSKLENIFVSAGNSNFQSVDGVLYSKDGLSVVCYPAGRNSPSYSVKQGTTTIDYVSFANCSNIAQISIPGSVKTIRDAAFYGCTKLTDVYYDGTEAEWNAISISDDNNSALTSATIHYNGTEPETKLGTCGDNLIWTFDEDGTLTISGTGDMYDYEWINYGADDDHWTLPVPWGIGQGNFSSNITRIVIQEGATHIGNNSFFDCFNLTEVNIPISITSIGDHAFTDCLGMTDVYYSGSKAQWDAIKIGTDNQCLTSANIHYNSTGPNDLGVDITEAVATRVLDGHTYYLFDRGMTWTEAKACCESLGGYLACITTSMEQEFLAQMIQNGNMSTYWLGGSDAESEGNWKWVSGEAWDYSNWAPGQPDNDYSGTESHLGISRINHEWASPGEWNDFTNEGALGGFVCEVNTTASMSDYYIVPMDFGALTINDSGVATAYYCVTDKNGTPLTGKALSYKLTGKPGITSVTTDKNGIFGIITPHLTYSASFWAEILPVESNTTVHNKDQFFDVNVKQLSYSQEWEGVYNGGVSLGVEAGVGVEAGPVELKAVLAGISGSIDSSKSISIEDKCDDGNRTLTLNCTNKGGDSLHLKSGLSSKLNVLKAELGPGIGISGTASLAQATEAGLVIENYDPHNNKHLRQIGLFSIVPLTYTSSLLWNRLFEKVSGDICNTEASGIDLSLKGGVDTSGVDLKIGVVKGNVQSPGEYASVWNWKDSCDYTNNPSYTTSKSFTISAGGGIGSSLGVSGTIGGIDISAEGVIGDYAYGLNLSNSKEISAKRPMNATKFDSVSYKVYDGEEKNYLSGSMAEDVYATVTYEGEYANRILESDPDMAKWAAGKNPFINIQDTIDKMFQSNGIASVKAVRKYKEAKDFTFPIGVSLGVKIGGSFGISGEHSFSWEHADGALYNSTVYTTSESDVVRSQIEPALGGLDDLLLEATRAAFWDIAQNMITKSGLVSNGVSSDAAKITGDKQPWFVVISTVGMNSMGGRSASQDESYAAITLLSEDDLNAFTTIGNPYEVAIYKDESGTTLVTDEELAANPVTLTLQYTEDMLQSAFADKDTTVMLLRYDPQYDGYVFVENAVQDMENMAVTAKIEKSGEYILAVNSISEPGTNILGDLNGDGKVTMADVIRLARGAAGYVTLTGQEQKAGDVTGDGKITMADVIRVARYAAGYSTSL